jgi:hypothetical protein
MVVDRYLDYFEYVYALFAIQNRILLIYFLPPLFDTMDDILDILQRKNFVSHLPGDPTSGAGMVIPTLVLQNGFPTDTNHRLEISPEQQTVILRDGIGTCQKLLEKDYVLRVTSDGPEIRIHRLGKVKNTFRMFVEKHRIPVRNLTPVCIGIFGKGLKKLFGIKTGNIGFDKYSNLPLHEMESLLQCGIVYRLKILSETDGVGLETLRDTRLTHLLYKQRNLSLSNNHTFSPKGSYGSVRSHGMPFRGWF